MPLPDVRWLSAVAGPARTLAALALLTAAAARAAGPELTGRVLLVDGRPAPAGTAVELRRYEDEVERARRLAAGRSDAPPPVATARPDARGVFTLTAPTGNWILSVRSPGWVSAAIPIAGLVDDAELDDVLLSAETRLRIAVRDAAGKPVEGAWISARSTDAPPRRSGVLRPSPWRRLERTDAIGAAAVGCVDGERLQVTIVGRGAVAESVARCAAAAPLPVVLPAAGSLRVQVRSSRNEPLADAVVVDAEAFLPLATTSREGTAEIPVPASGRDVAVLAPGHAVLHATLAPSPAGGPARTLRMEPRPRLTGRVLEAGTRRALPDALVWAWETPGRFGRTDGRGEFVLEADPARVLAAAAAHADAFLVDVDPRAPVTFVMSPVTAVVGRVVDVNRAPIADVRVEARPGSSGGASRMQRPEQVTARSRADGTFRLRGLSREVAYEILARREGFAPARVALPPPSPGPPTAPLEIVLGSGSEVLLKVLDAAGKPVAHARGELRARDPDDLRPRRVFDLDDDAGAVVAESDAAGTLSWKHVRAGTFDARVKARGFAALALPGVEIGTRAASAARVQDLGTVRLEAGAALEGMTVDPAGQPLGGVAIWARTRDVRFFGPDLSPPDATSASDGTFSILDLTPGALLNVIASAEGRSDARAEGVAVPREERLRLVLPGLSRVQGRVVDLTGKAVPGAEVSRFATLRTGFSVLSRGAPILALSGDDGRFVLDDVPAGSMRVSASRDGYLSGESGELEVLPGRDLEGVELVLRPGASVSGRVLDADGEPVAGVDVSVQMDDAPWGRGRGVASDGDGRYRLPEVPPGLRTLVAQSDDGGRAALEIEVKAGENSLDFHLEGGFTLSGTVVDERDQPVGGARVALVAYEAQLPGRPRQAISAADGGFTLRGVGKGRMSFVASAPGYADATLGPLPVEGPRDDLVFRLTQGGGLLTGTLRGLDLRELGSAEVMAMSSASWKRGIVDARGLYRVVGVAPGDWRVQATADGGRRHAQGSANVLEGAKETTLDLDFSGGFSLTGTVTRNRQPLAGASVFAFAMAGGSYGSVQTDADGRFRLDGLAEGKYSLGVRTFGAQLHHETVELTEDRDVAITITTGTVRGRVLDASDRTPLAGARVELLPAEVGAGEMFFSGAGAVSDSNGVFRLDDAVAGSFRVAAHLDGYAAGAAPVELAEGGDASVDVELERSDGVALDLSRPGAQGVDVAALDASGRAVYARSLMSTDAGRVRLTSLPRGVYTTLVATATDAVATLRVTAPGPPVPVPLVPGGRVEVSMPELVDVPQGGFVTLQSDTAGDFRLPRWGTVQTSWPAAFGKVEIAGVPPGTWTIHAAGSAPGQSWSATITVAPGATVHVALR